MMMMKALPETLHIRRSLLMLHAPFLVMRRRRARIREFIFGHLIVRLWEANPLIEEEDFQARDFTAVVVEAVDLLLFPLIYLL
jgi:hypothetical protein